MNFHRYVALGDSFTEGCGDDDADRPNGLRGWADRFAEVLAAREPDFGYANLAIRGRKLRPIIAEQVEPALAMRPDLVTIYAGGNDILRPRVDLNALSIAYDEAIGKLAATGATVVMFTAFDPGHLPIHRPMRGRWATYNEDVREIADRHGALVVDYWRMRHLRSWSFWAPDRLHMNHCGHQQVAMAVLDRLAIPHDLQPLPLPEAVHLSALQKRAAHLAWAREHAAPWVRRRLTGVSSGDSISPRRPTLAAIAPTAG